MLPLFLFAAASADSAVIEEIVVTALKRETTLRDTPLATFATCWNSVRCSVRFRTT